MIKRLYFLCIILFCVLVSSAAYADTGPKVAVMAFTLNDMTNLPNAPEELKRIELLSNSFRDSLKNAGLHLVPAGKNVQSEIDKHSPTYLYDNVATAIELNQDSGADYLVIGVALKPTYLFVYPRLIIVDVKSRTVVMSKAAQLESSWSDENTTIRTASKLAQIVKERVDALHAPSR